MYRCEFCDNGVVDYDKEFGGPPAPGEPVMCDKCKARFKQEEEEILADLQRRQEEM